jgi:hypothetical protein
MDYTSLSIAITLFTGCIVITGAFARDKKTIGFFAGSTVFATVFLGSEWILTFPDSNLATNIQSILGLLSFFQYFFALFSFVFLIIGLVMLAGRD